MRVFTSLIVTSVLTLPAAGQGNVRFARYPSISPDGSTIAFSWRGDLWTVSSAGGNAVRLTSHPANESRSAFSPDGRRLAFESDRNGPVNIFIMEVDGTDLRPVSELDAPLTLGGFGVDVAGGEAILVSSTIEGDVYRSARPFMISPEGGALQRVHDAFGSEAITSPDGRLVAFSRGGSSWSRRHYRGSDNRDVWLFNRDTGAFTRLTAWNGNDGKPRWGGPRTILYLSDRELDCVNLHRMSAEQGEAVSVRLTSFDDRDVWDYDVSADGSAAVLHAWDSLYTLDLRDPGAAPRRVDIVAVEDHHDEISLIDVDRRVSEAALSPDGQVMAVVAYGEVFVRNVDEGSPTRRVTHSIARERDIAWSPDGMTLFFVSDQDGSESIYAARVELTRGEIKDAYESTTSPPAAEAGPPDVPATEPAPSDPASAPDDPASAEGDDQDAPASDEEKPENDDETDSKDDPSKRWHDAWRFSIAPVVAGQDDDAHPSPSPDGRSLAFRRGGDLMILDLASGGLRQLATGWDTGIDWRWSPNSEFIAYQQSDRDFNSDIWIVRADGGAPPVNISRHPNNDVNPRWSGDGRILAFASERIADEFDVWLVFLDRDLEALPRIDLDKHFKNAGDAVKKWKPLAPAQDDVSPTQPLIGDELELDDAYLRLRRLTTLRGSETNLEVHPVGDRVLFSGSGDHSGIHTIKWDGTDSKKLADAGSMRHLTLKGDQIVAVSSSRAATIESSGGKTTFVDVSDRLAVNLRDLAVSKFREMARIIGRVFYHPTMKGLDWAALSARYLDLAAVTRTPDEFDAVSAYLLGELNGSHLGVNSPDASSPVAQPQGRIGVRTESVEGGLRVLAIVPESPAAKGSMALAVGDVITAVEFTPVGPRDTLERLLTARIGRETVFDVRRSTEDGAALDLRVLLTPISGGAERGLKYDAWKRENQRLVHEWSGGRVGYLHIEGMNTPSLYEFERDLFAAGEGREGLIIDVRNNGGGSTADLVLSSIMVRPHAYTVPRGADPAYTEGYPQDRLFIQRYIKPVNMMCNERSFSNAEIISHAFKTLRRGTLVGQQTYGGVISTGGTTLLDGTSVRLPFRGWYLPDGTDMENNGAMPDIVVPQTPEDESRGHDAQLKAAVDDLVARLD